MTGPGFFGAFVNCLTRAGLKAVSGVLYTLGLKETFRSWLFPNLLKFSAGLTDFAGGLRMVLLKDELLLFLPREFLDLGMMRSPSTVGGVVDVGGESGRSFLCDTEDETRAACTRRPLFIPFREAT